LIGTKVDWHPIHKTTLPHQMTQMTCDQPPTLDIPAEVMKTLSVDIGGSGIKALVLDAQGSPLGERDRLKTPVPATPDAVIDVIEQLANQQSSFDRVSVGFPGVVRRGVVLRRSICTLTGEVVIWLSSSTSG
jgi:ROK family